MMLVFHFFIIRNVHHLSILKNLTYEYEYIQTKSKIEIRKIFILSNAESTDKLVEQTKTKQW